MKILAFMCLDLAAYLVVYAATFQLMKKVKWGKFRTNVFLSVFAAALAVAVYILIWGFNTKTI